MTDPEDVFVNQLTRLERFDLPEVLAARLPLLDTLLFHRDEALANGFSYDDLIQEMDEALAVLDSEGIRSGFGITGRCWIHPQARIKDNVIIEGPCIVCKGVELGPRVYLGAGTVVGPYAKLGLGVVATATIIGAKSKIKYETTLTHTVIGACAEISETVAVALARQHPAPVTSWTTSGQPFQTNLPKLGAHIGAHAEISANSLIMPGSVIDNQVKIRNSVIHGFVTPLDISRESPNGGQDHGRRSILTSKTIALAMLLLVATLLGGLLIREALLMRSSNVPPQLPDSTTSATETTGTVGAEVFANSVVEPPPVSVEEDKLPMTELTLPLTTDRELIAPIHEANFTVQVAAFRQYQDAESLRNLLQDYGHPSYVVEAEIPDAGSYYRVRVGQYETADEAWDSGWFLEAQFSDVIPDPWIVPYEN